MIYITAPLKDGTDSFFMRYRLYSHCINILHDCGYDITLSRDKADRVVVVGMPGWDQCQSVAQAIDGAMENEQKIEVVELEEFL